MTHDIQSSEFIANFNIKKNLNIKSISGKSGKDKFTKVQATPMSMFSACLLCNNVPDIDFISYYWIFSENMSENGKNIVEVKTARNICCDNGRNTMAKPSVGNLDF
jgi:hypothetical protein